MTPLGEDHVVQYCQQGGARCDHRIINLSGGVWIIDTLVKDNGRWCRVVWSEAARSGHSWLKEIIHIRTSCVGHVVLLVYVWIGRGVARGAGGRVLG